MFRKTVYRVAREFNFPAKKRNEILRCEKSLEIDLVSLKLLHCNPHLTLTPFSRPEEIRFHLVLAIF